jgi:hypothetical protein
VYVMSSLFIVIFKSDSRVKMGRHGSTIEYTLRYLLPDTGTFPSLGRFLHPMLRIRNKFSDPVRLPR